MTWVTTINLPIRVTEVDAMEAREDSGKVHRRRRWLWGWKVIRKVIGQLGGVDSCKNRDSHPPFWTKLLFLIDLLQLLGVCLI